MTPRRAGSGCLKGCYADNSGLLQESHCCWAVESARQGCMLAQTQVKAAHPPNGKPAVGSCCSRVASVHHRGQNGETWQLIGRKNDKPLGLVRRFRSLRQSLVKMGRCRNS